MNAYERHSPQGITEKASLPRGLDQSHPSLPRKEGMALHALLLQELPKSGPTLAGGGWLSEGCVRVEGAGRLCQQVFHCPGKYGAVLPEHSSGI